MAAKISILVDLGRPAARELDRESGISGGEFRL
jgi:hypothetical protein